jgi:hypothetical protein
MNASIVTLITALIMQSNMPCRLPATGKRVRTGRAELRARAGPSPDLEDTYGCFRRTNETQYSNVARTWEPRETEKNVRAKKKLIPYA